MSEELKPCPFCGADAEWKEEDEVPFGSPFGLVVEHKADCFFGNHMMAEWETIITAWNTRPAPKADSALGDLPSRLMGWTGKARRDGQDTIYLDLPTVDRILAALSDRNVVLEEAAKVADAGATWGLGISQAVNGEGHTYSIEKVREILNAVASDIRNLKERV